MDISVMILQPSLRPCDCEVEVKGQKNFDNHKRKHKEKVGCPHCQKKFDRRSLAKLSI